MRNEQEIREKLREIREEFEKSNEGNLHYAGNLEALEWVLGDLEELI